MQNIHSAAAQHHAMIDSRDELDPMAELLVTVCTITSVVTAGVPPGVCVAVCVARTVDVDVTEQYTS
jgi:hypothetical protein